MTSHEKLEDLLKECNKEQLHLCGHIQPFGVLLGVSKEALLIVYASENLESLLGLKPEAVLGKKLSDIHPTLVSFAQKFLVKEGKEHFMYETIYAEEGTLDVKVFDAGEHLIFECERAEYHDHRANDALQCGIDLLKPPFHAKELPYYYDLLVKGIFEATKYDRVMLYKFHEDWSGEVISEMTKEGFGSYMGLRFPASDIPAIAREMYLKNPFRHIADTQSPRIAILSHDETTPDLTYSDTRSVSPVHIEYMKNMGMRASFSTPIIIFGDLWGLVACHNAEPKYISIELRRMCYTLAHSFAIGISSYATNEKLQKLDSTDRHLNALMERVVSFEDVFDGIESIEEALMQVVSCDGFCMIIDERILCIGDVMPQESLEMVDEWFVKSRQESIFSTDALLHSSIAKLVPQGSAAGLLATKTATHKGKKIRCYWFRNELKQEVAWAGNPNKPVIENAGVLKLSPRRSFERWIEVKSGYAKTWTGLDSLSAMKLNKTFYRWL